MEFGVVLQTTPPSARVVDLAKFLSKRGRTEESEQAFRAAERIGDAA